MKITFRKGKKYDGRMRLPDSYRVMVDGSEQATIQCTTKQFTWESTGTEPGDHKCWFWYGHGVNTSRQPDTLEVCKAQMRAFLQKRFSSGKRTT